MKIRTKSAIIALITASMMPMSALAGVVFQVETTYHSNSRGPESSEMSVEKPNLKMEIVSRRDGETGTQRDVAIFRGDRRQMVVVDHRDKTYMVMDTEAMRTIAGQVGGQMNQAMKELDAHMEKLDPKQREMMENLLKGQMGNPNAMPPGMPKGSMPGAFKPVKSEFRRTPQRASKQGYPCVKYEVLRGGEKVQELWVTDWSNVKGGKDAADAFKDMADFFEEMMDSMSEMAGGEGGGLFGGDGNSIDIFSKIDGFPVVTRDFEGGELESETVLESVTERDLDPDAFEPPKGYRLRTMGPQ